MKKSQARARARKTLRPSVKSARQQDARDRKLVIDMRRKLDAAAELELAESPDLPAALPPSLDSSFDQGESIAAAPVAAPGGKMKPPAQPAPIAAAPLAQEAQSVSPLKTGEHFLYSKILETYRSRNQLELQKTLRFLLRAYPESVFADNAVYLSGLLAFEEGDLHLAQAQFETVLKDYPRSNKAVSALFAKASIEKRTGQNNNAKRSYIRVRDLYPGSPEAARVSVELKLLELATSKRRES